jgi:hypothetical protein
MTLAELLNGALKQLLNSKLPAWLWGLAILVFVLPGLFLAYLESVDGATWLTGLLIPWLAALIALYWFLIRGIGHATSSEDGSFGAWFGWTLVAGIPMVVFIIGIAAVVGFENSEVIEAKWPWWIVSLLFSVTLALPAPILVHSVGRAIDRKGPSFGSLWANLKSNYVILFIAYFITLLPSMLGDALTEEFGADHGFGVRYTASMFGWLSYFVQFVLSTALLAFVWRSLRSSVSHEPEPAF